MARVDGKKSSSGSGKEPAPQASAPPPPVPAAPAPSPSAEDSAFGHVRSRKVRIRQTPPDASHFAERIADLQQQLQEKEEVILTLTARLEQAAEQLDRLKRCGGTAPTGRGGGASLPGQLLDDHRTAIEDLKSVIARWEAMQCEATLGRLETQVAELRDLIAGHGGSARASFSLSEAPPVAEKKSTGNWWESTKAAMLAGEEPPPPPSSSTPAYEDSDTARTARTSEPLELPGLPEPLNLEELTLEMAVEAIRERDRLLIQYRELLLTRQAAQDFAHVSSIHDLPDALRDRLSSLEDEWQVRFRNMELELSRERARLARTEASLRQQQEQLQKELAHADSAASDESPSADEPRRRWFRFLGKRE